MGRVAGGSWARTELGGVVNRSMCMGWPASCGASSCQLELLSSARGSMCACTERTVMNTCVKDVEDPLGAMQLGGSLMETFTVPMLSVCICVLPPQLTPIDAESKNATPASNTPAFRWVH